MKEIPGYGDLMTIEEFIGAVKVGALINYDGFGNLAMENGMSEIEVRPSYVFDKDGKITDRFSEFMKEFTHVVWFNR